jgi:hypothetical protein
MARDLFAVLENMPVTINDFRLLFHRTFFANVGLKTFAQEHCGFILKARTEIMRALHRFRIADSIRLRKQATAKPFHDTAQLRFASSPTPV